MRVTARSSRISANVQVTKIYPVESDTKTIGMCLDPKNARQLAIRLLLLAEDEPKSIDLTAFRRPAKGTGTMPLTITVRK